MTDPVVRLDRIYTRGGDAGETSLGDGRRVSKAALRIAAYGTVDELGAVLGLARTHPLPAGMDAWLGRIQNDLFDLGADLCVPEEERGDRQSTRERTRLRMTPAQVAWLEQRCDEVNETLPPLTSFVLAGGTPGAALPAPGAHRMPPRRARGRRAGGERAGRRRCAAVPEPALRPALPARPRGQRGGRGGALGAGRGAQLMARREREALHETLSGIPVEPLYSPETTPLDYSAALGDPGSFPYTRGPYGTMHRGQLWTMRMFAGFGTADETNERFRYLLDQGQTGLSTAFDMPSLMGYDSDAPRALGEVGREGVAIDTLADMEDLFAGIPLDKVTVSMTINAPAAMVLAMYACMARRRGIPLSALGGTIQTDILKEFIAQKEWIFPPQPSVGLVVDMIEWCCDEMPRWHPVSISGYHIREAGATAAQELAFTLADGFAYVEACVARGLPVDRFAPRLSFFFNAHLDFFEEIAKYRAARRIWARELRDRFGAREERSLLMRFHAQTAGVSLTAQQPEINVVRTAVEALAAVLGGCQSLHTNSFDEALALPTEAAATLALRTQQVLAHEVGVTSTADPLGGSWYVEHLTDRLEHEAYEIFKRIDGLGGVIAAIDAGYFQRELADSAFRYQQQVESGDRVIVGVNRYVASDEQEPELLHVDPIVEERQIARLAAVRARRDSGAVESSLARLRDDAEAGRNVMPALVECSDVYASLGEMCDVLRAVWGVYRETPVF